MSAYTNGINININDIVRLTFSDSANGKTNEVSEVCMQFEFLKAIHETIGGAIVNHEEKIAKAKKVN